MDKELTEIVFILDRSGSMEPLTGDTIGGYNSYIKSQQGLSGKTRLTTVLFDDQYELLHDNVDIELVKPITNLEYFARGSTALLDAIGITMNTVANRLASLKKSKRPSKVLFVITTDGYENSSKEFTKDQIKAMVDLHTNSFGWQFIFLGANIDAFDVGNSYGISASANYSATKVGTQTMYSGLISVTNSYRDTGTLTTNLEEEIK